MFAGRRPLEPEPDAHQACSATHLSGPSGSFLPYADAAGEMGGSPRSRQSRGSRGNFSMDPQISTRIPALAQDLVYRRCSINICWLAKGVVGRGRIVREHVAEWMSFNYTQTASRLHDSHSGRQTPGTARPQGLDCSGLRPHRRGQGGNFPARGEVNARDCRTQ